MSKLSCRAAVAQDAQIARVAWLPRITEQSERPERPERPEHPRSNCSPPGDFGLVLGLLGVLMEQPE